jgi:hypothetical protein
MARTTGEDNDLYAPKIRSTLQHGCLKMAVAGATLLLDDDMPPVIALDPAQALTVTLPAPRQGLLYYLLHTSTGNFDITVSSPVNRAGAAGATTMGVISQNQIGIAISDGVTWFVGMMPQT